MKKQYTKKQIVEAIKHWTKQLHLMNESYNIVIDTLINDFGYDLVTSKEFNYTLTQKDLKKIFNILNQHLFGNKIKFLPVVLWPMEKLVNKLNYHSKMSGDSNELIKQMKCLGVHSAISIDIRNSDNELIDIKFRDDYLIINSSEVHDDIFIFDVAIICHEMIHFYDYQYSNETHDMVLNWEKYRKTKPMFHKTRIFIDKMQEANENGINVVSELSSDKTYKTDNINARYTLKQAIGENENPDVEILQSEHDLFIHNKKTGYGFFCHFD